MAAASNEKLTPDQAASDRRDRDGTMSAAFNAEPTALLSHRRLFSWRRSKAPRKPSWPRSLLCFSQWNKT
jgi:hypothetical protein